MGLLDSAVIMILFLIEGEIRVKPLNVVLKLVRSQPFVGTISTLGNPTKKLRVVLGDEGWIALLGTHGITFRLIRTCILVEGLWGNSLRLGESIQ